MSYYPLGHRDEVDDFNDYDPTPYGGGYDISLTYGRSLPPSYETCYTNTSSASDFFDYRRPRYNSYAEPCAYASEALDNEYRSYVRPKPRPGPPISDGGYGYDGPKPNYGFQPGGGVSEYGGRAEYGPGYGRKPLSPEIGSEYGRRTEQASPGVMHGSEYGRKPEYGGPGYGSGVYGRGLEPGEFQPSYGKKPGLEFDATNFESGVYGHGGRPERSEYGKEKPSYATPTYPEPRYPKPSYPEPTYAMPAYPEPSYPKPSYPEPSYPMPTYPVPNYPKPSYPEPNYAMPTYPEPSYPKPSYPEPSSYAIPSKGRSEMEDYRKPNYGMRDDNDNEGYGRKQYGDDNSDDEEKKRHHPHHNHHHHHHHHHRH